MKNNDFKKLLLELSRIERNYKERVYSCIRAYTLWGEFKITKNQLETLKNKIKGIDFDHWRDDDSPKGENVIGVRHR